jgi:hypothetical protein
LGLEFEGIDDWSRYVIERDLRWIPPTPPGQPRISQSAICTARILARLSGRSAGPAN